MTTRNTSEEELSALVCLHIHVSCVYVCVCVCLHVSQPVSQPVSQSVSQSVTPSVKCHNGIIIRTYHTVET